MDSSHRDCVEHLSRGSSSPVAEPCGGDCARLTPAVPSLPAGGGAIQLIMPQLYDGLLKHHPSFVAWRWAFFVPGSLHIIVAALVLFAATVRINPSDSRHYPALRRHGERPV